MLALMIGGPLDGLTSSNLLLDHTDGLVKLIFKNYGKSRQYVYQAHDFESELPPVG